MRVHVGLVAAAVLTAMGVGFGVGYTVAPDETRRELEEAFGQAEVDMRESLPDSEGAAGGVSGDEISAAEAEWRALPQETANAVCTAAESRDESAVEATLVGAGVATELPMSAWIEWCLG